jgi:hypothetical protein
MSQCPILLGTMFVTSLIAGYFVCNLHKVLSLEAVGNALLFATNLVGIIDDKLILFVMNLIFSEL